MGEIENQDAGVRRHSNATACCDSAMEANTIVDRTESATPWAGSAAPHVHPKNRAAPTGTIAIEMTASTGPRKPNALPSTAASRSLADRARGGRFMIPG